MGFVSKLGITRGSLRWSPFILSKESDGNGVSAVRASTSQWSLTEIADTMECIGGCPTSHPYAYLNGNYCCQTNEELTNGGTQSEKDSGTCDGINFNEQSTCCKNHGFIPCPSANGCSTGFGF